MVGVVLEALVDQTVCSTGNQVFIEFHPKDGTKVNRNLRSDTRELHGGTMLLDDFWEKIKPFVPATSELDGTQWELIDINGGELVEGTHISLSLFVISNLSSPKS